MVIVPKPDRTIRLCMGYRKVNTVSMFDTFPMLQVDNVLEMLGQAHVILTLNLTKGY